MLNFAAFRSLLSDSGGLKYHLKAIRYKNSCWLQYRNELNKHILKWKSNSKTLVMLGPSFGYTLDWGILFQRFDDFVFLEPDPLAQIYLKKIILGAKKNYLFDSLNILERPEYIDRLMEAYPEAAFFFANFLGQAAFYFSDSGEFLQWRKHLEASLQRRSFFSSHDLMSTEVDAESTGSLHYQKAPTIRELIKSFYPQKSDLKVNDHLMEGFLPDRERYVLLWELSPHEFHFMEVIYQ